MNQHIDEFPAEPRRPYQGHPYPAPPPVPKPKTRKGLTVLLAATGLVIGLIIGGSIGSAGQAPVTAEPAPTASTAKKPVEKEAEKKPATFGDGTYEVGVDIEPGRYKVTVPADGAMCLYQRLKDDTGDRGTIIAQDVKQPGAKASVTIKKSDGFFETSGCGEWVRQ
jgi:hypothetical protein